MSTQTSSRSPGFRFRAALFVLIAGVLAAPSVLAAQGGKRPRRVSRTDTTVYSVDPVVVTATRGPREVSRIPQPVSVVQRRDIVQDVPNTVSDLFRSLPGLDVTGVGVNQGRPEIRGQRGQRILLLEDGLRLNNFRRQQDFGELPALVDVNGVERVEVVRGPASVLYGSDAIGGVVNIITRTPQEEGLHGTASGRYGDVENQRTGSARIYGRFGAFTVRGGGTVRNADAYTAPAGHFGDITLANETAVSNTGVRDRSLDLRLGWEPAGKQSVFAKVESYKADDAGFGSVDPSLYAPGDPKIDITYPDQKWTKLTAGYRAERLGAVLADRVEIEAYDQRNTRDLNLGFQLPLGPGALITIANKNYTDIRTYGLRAEARKLATPSLLFTYGIDLLREHAAGNDNSSTLIEGFGPPMKDVSTRPQLPTSTFLTLGAFLQGEVTVTDRFSFVAGGRYQRARAETFATAGLEDQSPTSITDGTMVAAVNSLYRLGAGFSLVGSVGRAFRSPNLIERFFDGPTPEGSGYQVRNPDLKPETSLNVDLGVRYRHGPMSLEGFAFHNKIRDGVRIAPLGTKVQGQDAYQNVNVDQLVFRGVELNGDVFLDRGFAVGASFSKMDAKDAVNVENPVGESFSSKVTGYVRYTVPSDRGWVEWQMRHNGNRKDVALVDNPVGDHLPAFTVQDVRAGVTLFRTASGVTNTLNLALTNVTNALYAEFSNVSFFRPEPKRNLTLSWNVSF